MGSKVVKVGVVGGAGYTGGETLRLLVNHAQVQISFVLSRSQSGKQVSEIHKDLEGDINIKFSDSLQPADVLFLCLGHGESKQFLADNNIPTSTKIIDLSQDFRLGESSNGRSFIYGLPEANKEKISSAQNIANPGCFATAIQLGLLPMASKGLLNEVYTTGITGSTGAGQKLQGTSHFTWRTNNISAYKTLTHQHLKEINRTLGQLLSEKSLSINFIPWRGDFTRGIFISSVLTADMSITEANKLYESYYKDAAFTHVSQSMIDLKQVVNTNKCLIHLEKEGDKLVIHSAIDNLLKGASGQAVQNMNLMFGLDEKAGLNLKSIGY